MTRILMELAGLLVVNGKLAIVFLVAERKKGRRTHRGKRLHVEGERLSD